MSTPIVAIARISRNVPNLMAAAKNIGTTHFTNSAYRLHPTEWAIGNAAGEAAHHALAAKVQLRALVQDPKELQKLQLELINLGQPLVWYDDVPITSRQFKTVQAAAILGLLPPRTDTLHFSSNQPVTAGEVKAALQNLGYVNDWQVDLADGAPVTWKKLAEFKQGTGQDGVVRRGDFAVWVLGMYTDNLNREATGRIRR